MFKLSIWLTALMVLASADVHCMNTPGQYQLVPHQYPVAQQATYPQLARQTPVTQAFARMQTNSLVMQKNQEILKAHTEIGTSSATSKIGCLIAGLAAANFIKSVLLMDTQAEDAVDKKNLYLMMGLMANTAIFTGSLTAAFLSRSNNRNHTKLIEERQNELNIMGACSTTITEKLNALCVLSTSKGTQDTILKGSIIACIICAFNSLLDVGYIYKYAQDTGLASVPFISSMINNCGIVGATCLALRAEYVSRTNDCALKALQDELDQLIIDEKEEV